jgi:hypothetical protein
LASKEANGRSGRDAANRRRFAEPQAIESIDPCVDCPRSAACVTQQLACLAFESFTKGRSLGHWRKLDFQPTAALFVKIFSGD